MQRTVWNGTVRYDMTLLGAGLGRVEDFDRGGSGMVYTRTYIRKGGVDGAVGILRNL